MSRQEDIDRIVELLSGMEHSVENIRKSLAGLKKVPNPIIDKDHEPALKEVDDSLRKLDSRLNRLHAHSF